MLWDHKLYSFCFFLHSLVSFCLRLYQPLCRQRLCRASQQLKSMHLKTKKHLQEVLCTNITSIHHNVMLHIWTNDCVSLVTQTCVNAKERKCNAYNKIYLGNSWSVCICLPTARITTIYHWCQTGITFIRLDPKIMLPKTRG